MASNATGENLTRTSSSAPTPPGDSGSLVRRSFISQALYDTFGQRGAKVGAVWIAAVVVLAVFAPLLANSHPIVVRPKGGALSSPLLASLTPIDVGLLVLFIYALWVIARRLTVTRSMALILWPVLGVMTTIVTVRYGLQWITFQGYRPPWLEGLQGGGAVFGWTWVILVNLVVVLIGLAGLAAAAFASWRFFTRVSNSALDVAGSLIVVALLLASAFWVNPPPNPVYEHYREMEETGQLQTVVRTLVPFSPNDRLRDQPDATLRAPDRHHWLGTTLFGEDLLSRMLHACRVALAIGIIATGISTLIGIFIGGVMGYYAGAADLIGMRVLEIIEAIPTLILLLIVTVFFGRNLYLMMVVIGLVTWTSDARFIRAEFLKLRNLDFVQAAIAVGLRRSSIIFRHMLPNGIAPVLVNASFGIAGAILLESTLSFLGLGLGPDDPSWGQLLNQARSGGRGFSWWIATFPGAAIFLTVFSYILIGEAMRDAIDPRLRKRD